jgi:TFIIF-interacting CTD phosphatase-like protein
VFFRPGLIKMLDELVNNFELCLFSLGTAPYVTEVLKLIEKKTPYFKKILSRDQNLENINGKKVKDLSILFNKRSRKSVIMVDNKEDGIV